MIKHIKKLLLFCIIFVFLFSIFNIVSAQDLETIYLDVPGTQTPTTTGIDITQYVKYIYYFFVGISGFLAFVFLTIGGVMLLTSAGDPNKINEAKKRIYSALWGLLFILSSYYLLNTINPDLVNLRVPTLVDQSNSTYTPPPTKSYVPTILERVKEIANNTIISIDGLADATTEIENLTDDCHCKNTQSLCVCDGADKDSDCKAVGIYSKGTNEPCPDIRNLEIRQKDIIAWKEEIFYYKNRAMAEENDLSLAIGALETERRYYEERLPTETDQKVIDFLIKKQFKLIQEINLRTNLAGELHNLAHLISNLEPNLSKLAKLPEECLENVKTRCFPLCSPKINNSPYGPGCFDVLLGCFPLPVVGGNPCPTTEIHNRVKDYQSLSRDIQASSNSILNQVEVLINFKTLII